MVQPESHQTVQTGHLGGTSDRSSVQGLYLHSQNEFQHETNFIGFYTQEEVQPNWNRAKIFAEKEVMNFTSQRFSSLSICEYPILEGDSSPRKERPEAKPIIGVKSSLSSFQKAQDHEKWPWNYEVMIQSPKPVKPVLHLPQLEANRFNQLQTRHWRPGDHFNQSGDTLGVQEEFCKFIPCTSNHWIRRIPIYSNLPYLEQTDINVQQLFSFQIRHEIRTYQAPRKVPRKLSYPLKPSRFKKNQVSHLEPKSHKRLQRLVSDFVTLLDFLVCLCKSNKLSTQIERVNHFDPSFHQIVRFNQTFIRKSTSVHLLIKLRVIHIQQLDSILFFKEPDHKLSHEPIHKWKPKSEQSIVQVPKPMVRFILDQHVLNISMTDIMHLLFVQNVEDFSGYKEESFKGIPPDILLMLRESTPKMIKNVATKNLKDHPLQKIRNDHVQRRGVIHSYFLKGEPPDTQSIPKPKQSQGKALESQKRMKADLLYLGAGYIVSRSKPCQERGDVVVTKSMVQPESHQTVQTGHLGGTSDRSSVQGVYLHRQNEFQYETNFIGFYTQEGVQPNWNRAKIFAEKEVMNFTSQRFSSLSICEYPILEGDSSPRKERPEAKPIIGVKSSLSSF
ncbi:hypothetical protein YC2023_108225 [Brassica napus]